VAAMADVLWQRFLHTRLAGKADHDSRLFCISNAFFINKNYIFRYIIGHFAQFSIFTVVLIS
jgi:hypothetical protein